jgi:hypothetical protein
MRSVHLSTRVSRPGRDRTRNTCSHNTSGLDREAKASAIDTWADRWLNNNRRSQTYIALPTPPSEKDTWGDFPG